MHSRWVRKGKVVGPFGWVSITVVIIFLFLTGATVSVNVWYQKSLQAPSTGEEKVFVIKKGESSKAIAERLEEEGLIKSALAFRIHLFSSNTDESIEAGSFKLNSNQTAQEISEELRRGQLDRWITLVEGLRIEEMAEKLSNEFDINEDKFIELADEGYMFPDTYLIPIEASEEKIVSIMRNNFDKKVSEELRSKARKEGLSLKELITLASIVERESRVDDERPIIAGILLKRFKEGIPLAADATLQYALGYQADEKTWWKKALTVEDLESESPYNTRKVAGFPPGPICNPGLSSIQAVTKPKSSPYYYYIHDPDGQVHYARTFEEHQENIAKHLN